ncbi:MAG: DNA-processing protein DprA [Gammaproteobacteria bacterium]|nr:DNA-processing protein DprA [Gammaproteobacteria bacterium]
MNSTSIQQDDLRYWLALSLATNLTAHRFHELIRMFGSPKNVLQSDKLTKSSLRLSESTRQSLQLPDWQKIDEHLQWSENDPSHHIIPFIDPLYPIQLREIADPPPTLFIRGNPDSLLQPQIALVGSRNPTPTGRETAYAFAQALAEAGLTITSGMALGIDAASHRGALAAKGRTIAVFGTGIDVLYPSSHRKLATEIAQRGALVSEFPLHTPPVAGYFPQRNRVVSGLSLGTLVVEAASRSGSLITARFATEQGREVFAIPGSIHSPTAHGCHILLRNGAKLVETATDILEEITHFQPLFTSKSTKRSYNNSQNQLDEENRKLLECVGFEATSVDALVNRTGFCVERVTSALMILELKGLIYSTPGGYSRV